MPVTELAVLGLTNPYNPKLPTIREFLRKAGTCQAKWSGYPVLFFDSTSASNEIYLISGWASVGAHNEWIASAENQALLREGEGFIIVIDLMHIDIDFAAMPVGSERILWTRGGGLDPTSTEIAGLEPGGPSGRSWDAVGRIVDQGVAGSVIRMRAYCGEGVKKEQSEENRQSGQLTREGVRMLVD